MASVRYTIFVGAGFFGGILYRDKTRSSLWAKPMKATDSEVPTEPNVAEGHLQAETTIFKISKCETLLHKAGLTRSYNNKTKGPNWVLETLTPNHVDENTSVSRSKSDFYEDDEIDENFRSTNNDYKGSGYDKGHLAPACNYKNSQRLFDDTFSLSNVSPQVGKGFNQGKWNKLEKHVCDLCQKNEKVDVCTGPLFIPRKEEDGKKYVKYEVIGDNNVAVPTHFFKVIVCETKDKERYLESYVMPNKKIDDNVTLKAFQVDPGNIEKHAGYTFFDKPLLDMFISINGQPSRKRRKSGRKRATGGS